MHMENKLDLKNKLVPTAIDMEQAGETSLFSKTETVNSGTNYQQYNETLDESEQRPLKKIKTTDTNDTFYQIWSFLQQNPSNFNTWVNILEMVDSKNNADKARMVFSKFLELYPLCYGYWIRYANFEKRNNNLLEFKKVLEDSLIAIPICVDLWIEYMKCLRMDPTNKKDYIRNEFERSLKSCGLDYRSDQLWRDYISWEVEEKNLINAAKIYYRLFHIPTSKFQNNFYHFQKLVYSNLPEHILELPELELRRSMIVKKLVTPYVRCMMNNESFSQCEQEISNNVIQSKLTYMIVESRNEIFKQTDIEYELRRPFEKKIKRPFYHVVPMNFAEIENWKNYISFEKTMGNTERVIFLYERCLIACVSIEEFWLDYLDYLSSIGNDVSGVFKRALFHHSKSLQLNLKYFDFAMSKGWVEVTSDTIKKLYIISPTSKEVATRMMHAGDGGCQNGNLC